MSTTKEKVFLKEFKPIYNSPAMRLHLEEEGWKYVGQNNNNPIYKIILS
jgi:hypothetical protein